MPTLSSAVLDASGLGAAAVEDARVSTHRAREPTARAGALTRRSPAAGLARGANGDDPIGRAPAVAARPVAAEDRVTVLARARIPAGTRAETDAVMVVFIVDVQSDGTGPAVVRASRMRVSG